MPHPDIIVHCYNQCQLHQNMHIASRKKNVKHISGNKPKPATMKPGEPDLAVQENRRTSGESYKWMIE